VDAGELSPAFDPGVFEYSLTVDAASITVNAAANNAAATVAGAGTHMLNVGSNTLYVKVTAGDGTLQTYKLTVVRQQTAVTVSSDASLKSLMVFNWDLTPVFNPEIFYYTLSVDSESVTIDAEANSSAASVVGTGRRSLTVGQNTFDITVTAEDGTVGTYTLTVTRTEPHTPSSDASLKSLAVVGYDLTPAFNTATHEYSITVDVVRVTINAEANHAAATVTGTGTTALNAGLNQLRVTVTAEDGTKEEYVLMITRSGGTTPSDDATLKNLTVDRGVYEPVFASNRFYYLLIIDAPTVTIGAEPNHPGAIVDGAGLKQLTAGVNVFNVTVNAENGNTLVYTLAVIRSRQVQNPDSDARLKNLSVNPGRLTPAFNTDMSYYMVTVDVETITIAAEANNSGAKVVGAGTKSLSLGANAFNITVTSKDGTATMTYTVLVLRSQERSTVNDNARLKSLTTDVGILTPKFNPDTYSYVITVDAPNITISAEAIQPGAMIIGTGRQSLNVGGNVFNVMCTTGAGTQVYTLLVMRSQQGTVTDARLKSLTADRGVISPAFNPETFNYFLSVDVETITISAEATEAGATVTGTGKKNLELGINAMNVTVGNGNGAARIYSLFVARTLPNPNLNGDATLKSLTTDKGNVTPAFHADTLGYTLAVSDEVESLTITAVPNAETSIVAGAGAKPLNVGDNPVSITVTAEDGTVRVYTLVVTRSEVTETGDATLKSLTTDRGEVTPTFHPDTVAYTLAVPNEVDTITVTAVPNVEASTVTGDGKKPLNVGNNPFSITVTAEDGTVRVYTLVVKRSVLPIRDATLKSLTTDRGDVTPTFHPDTVTYSLSVQHEIDTVTIIAVPNAETSAVAGDGKQSLTYGSSNIFEIRVTAEDGTEMTYTLRVTRNVPPISDASLKILTTDRGEVSPTFHPDTVNYTLAVPTETDTVTIIAVPNQETATVVGDGQKPLTEGHNVFNITVTSEDGTERIYTLVVTRSVAPVSDASLRSLTVNRGNLSPAFHPDTLNYSIFVAGDVATITVNAVANQETATVEGTGTKQLTVGLNRLEIKVTSEDGTERIYTLSVMRSSSKVMLKSLTVNHGKLSPEFGPDITRYTVTVVDSVSEIVIGAEPFYEDATVEGTGTHPLELKEHFFYIIVKSGTTSRSYEVKVVRQNGNARLKKLGISTGTLTPTFHEDSLNYMLVVPGHVTSIGITPAPANALATVTGGGIIPIGPRDTVIAITVTSEDKVTTLVYNILVTRNSNITDARLESIILSGGVLEPAFSPDVLEYSVLLPCGKSDIDINATPSNGCTLQYFADRDSVSEYPKGDSVSISLYAIRSTAIDGKYLDYKITIVPSLDSALIVPYWNDVLAVNLNTSTNGGYIFTSFQWTKDGDPIAGETGSYIKFPNPSPGSYGVILVGNGKKTSVCPVRMTGTRSTRGLTAYPNPASDNITVESLQQGTSDKIELYDLNGQRLRTYPSTGAKTIINISEYTPGIYILRQGVNSATIIKQ
jgi:hypothetical protein